MKHKPIIIGLAVLAALLLVRGYIKLSKVDQSGPVISYSGDAITYTDGEEYSNLLQGVTAVDKRDGDVSDTLIVEKVHTDEKEKKATITYAAVDRSNNLTKKNRTVNYDQSNSTKPTNTQKPSGTEEPSQTANATPTPAMVVGTAPILYLKTNEITVKKGEKLDIGEFVAHIIDDKDSEEKMLTEIKTIGVFNTKQKGTYEIALYVIDSDKNKSNVESVTLNVE